jgi:putative tryptophan/tyrosine transport system substrate-binding protein
MKRRQFIAGLGSAAAWPMVARAQRAAMPVIGILYQSSSPYISAFRQGLRELGYIEGQNIVVEDRPADRADRLPDLATELVGLKVQIIVAEGSQAVRAAQQATKSIPIVMTASSDPVGTGFVTSLARPDGNITGMSLAHVSLLPL